LRRDNTLFPKSSNFFPKYRLDDPDVGYPESIYSSNTRENRYKYLVAFARIMGQARQKISVASTGSTTGQKVTIRFRRHLWGFSKAVFSRKPVPELVEGTEIRGFPFDAIAPIQEYRRTLCGAAMAC